VSTANHGISQLILLLGLLFLIVPVSVAIRKTKIPLPLALVVVGAILGSIPGVPILEISPDIVLFLFLPILVCQTSASGHWRDTRDNIRPIALLSLGHVIFVTALVAWCCHAFMGMTWILGVIVGAVLSPPDDTALVSIARKLPIPRRIVTVLAGEGLFNDATALMILRFSIIAAATHSWSFRGALAGFFGVVFCEGLYGFALGFLITELRRRLKDPELEILVSLISPFLAYIPSVALGGSGVIATAILGFYVGQARSKKFGADARLLSSAVWITINFIAESLLFLWAGLSVKQMFVGLEEYSTGFLLTAGLGLTLALVIGRFIWIFASVYIPQFIFGLFGRKDWSPPWRNLIVVGWGGMRGAISIAAVLTIPVGTITANQRQLMVFLTFCAVIVTLLVQGLTLPALLHWLGLKTSYDKEQEHFRVEIRNAREALDRISARASGHTAKDGVLDRMALIQERKELARLFEDRHISTDSFLKLEREIDHRESSLILKDST